MRPANDCCGSTPRDAAPWIRRRARRRGQPSAACSRSDARPAPIDSAAAAWGRQRGELLLGYLLL